MKAAHAAQGEDLTAEPHAAHEGTRDVDRHAVHEVTREADSHAAHEGTRDADRHTVHEVTREADSHAAHEADAHAAHKATHKADPHAAHKAGDQAAREADPADHRAAREVIDIATGTWRAQALYAAAALRIPDHIAGGAVSCEALAALTGTGEDAVRRLMRLLATMGVFEGTETAGYRLNAVSTLLRSDVSGSMRDMCLIYGEEFHRAWGAVLPALRTGGTGFEEAFGSSLGDYLRDTPGAGPKFQRAMSVGSAPFATVSRAIDFSRHHTVVDVGGGYGTLLSLVLRGNPGLRGVLFDLPHMAPLAHEHLADAVDPGRYEIVTGDVFEEVPPGGDAYLLSRVLQDWDDADCVRLLVNCRRAMGSSGRLFILERVVAEDRSTALPVLWDVHLMLIAGGRERTLPEYRSLLARAGLRLESLEPLPLETSLLVASPA
ncbi:methyltransferase [Streptomyces iconiensis]|uniref:Methyltransferase n=1 Tax=Streptomyces iconiensis TaxID=1384038 RepID=A0ABT6ZNB4_9ACTN|nr:methyltransferase [Streptomyces iconiensis]MDJ1130550.1 methyltransferase [Streptomyces iconiensis]